MTVMVEQLPEQPEPAAKPRRLQRMLPFLIIFVGILVVLYPVVGTIVQNMQQQQTAKNYTNRILDEFTAEQRQASIAAAHRWNDENAGGPILDPWLARIDSSNIEYQDYLQQLNLDEVMARIIIPSIDSDLPVYHGTDEETLEKGVGHLFGSSLPVGGESSHAVLTGHTGLSHATLWDNLVDVDTGDAFYINVAGETLKYEVHSIEVVAPNDSERLGIVEGEDLVTLITCTPYGVNSHRLLVTGHRVDIDPAEGVQILEQKRVPWQWWMTAAIAMIVIALGLLTLLWGRIKQQREAEEGS
ncbi:MAG: class C sortase [Corynebacterium sp.]|nr:class C sortase [Corynebacterium sp.]